MNVVVIVLDCLRLDYSNEIWKILSKYGFHKMDFAITTAPWTIPAHASMLTGLYPSEHGAHEDKIRKVGNIEFSIKDNIINDLKKVGYKTYLFTANAFLTKRFGFDDFNYIYFNSNIPDKIFLKPDELRYLTEKTLTENPFSVMVKILKNKNLKLLLKGFTVFTYRKISSVFGGWPKEKGISKITAKIKETKFEEPFFIFVNLMELHEPYRSENIKTEYEFQLKYLMEKFKKFVDILDKKATNSLVIVTSDHGQLLGENGRRGHGIFLDDELIKVPFFIKIPNNSKPLKSSGYISHANLRRFILKAVNGKIDTRLLFSDVVFAESFGSYSNKVIDSSFEKHMIAIYYNGCKGVYDVENRRFDNISNQKMETKLKYLVEEFLKKVKIHRKYIERKHLKSKIRKLKIDNKI